MGSEVPGPAGNGASDPSLERARLRMYRPGASPDDVIAYERLLASAPPDERESSARAAVVVDEPAPDARDAGLPGGRARSTAVIGGVAVLAVVVVAAVLIPQVAPALPTHLGVPSGQGSTLTTLFRDSDPRVLPGTVTYQPQGYTVFDPYRPTLHVAIRCQGAGRVLIAAGQVFAFRCTDRRAVLRQSQPAAGRPFVVTGRTTGNVVWTARITAD